MTQDGGGDCRRSTLSRVLAYLGRVARDIHQGVINGFDALWYG
jgi:hypothetical protein